MPTVLEKVEAKTGVLESFNPATGEKLGEVPLTAPEDMPEVARRARKAQEQWAALGARGRGRILHRLKQVMLDRAEEIARVVSSENGKPPAEVVTLILPICEAIKLYTKVARRVEGGKRVSPTALFTGARARILYEPMGVAGFIMPWNFPFELGVKHMIPALAAGNAVIQKPSEVNPLIGELIGSLFEDAGVPDGLVQIVQGRGDVGAALIDEVDVICFVGSPGTGRRIMARAAERLIPVVLELGGNDAAIVRRDADIDRTARGLVFGSCYNAGQVCAAIERIYVHTDIAAPLTEKVIEHAKTLRQGELEGYDLGPITFGPQLEIYERHVADAAAKGANVRLGGKAIQAHGGVYWPPTVLTGVDHTMKVMKEETFGPFISIMEVKDDEEAIRLANDSPYGLSGSVWTGDRAAGERVARRMKTGSVMINNAITLAGCVTLPFGGARESGVGRALSEMGYYNYVSPKSLLTAPRGKIGELGWLPYPEGAKAMMLGLAATLYSSRLGRKLAGLMAFLRGLRRG